MEKFNKDDCPVKVCLYDELMVFLISDEKSNCLRTRNLCSLATAHSLVLKHTACSCKHSLGLVTKQKESFFKLFVSLNKQHVTPHFERKKNRIIIIFIKSTNLSIKSHYLLQMLNQLGLASNMAV